MGKKQCLGKALVLAQSSDQKHFPVQALPYFISCFLTSSNGNIFGLSGEQFIMAMEYWQYQH